MNEPIIQVQYNCKYCGVSKAQVDVPERFIEEHILDWMNIVGAHVKRHHRHYQPHCVSSSVDLMVPMPVDAEYLGHAGRQ